MAGSPDTLPPRPKPLIRIVASAKDGQQFKVSVGPYFVGDYDEFGVLPPYFPYDTYGSSTGPMVDGDADKNTGV